MSLSRTSRLTLADSAGSRDDPDDDASSAAGSSPKKIDSSSANGSNTETNQTGTTDEDFQSIKNALTKKESQQVFRLRVLVVLILIAAAAAISFTIYYLERTTQVDEFEAAYYGSAEKIIDSLQQVTETISAIGGVAVTATVEAQQQFGNATLSKPEVVSGWPFFTMKSFQERANNARALAGILYLSMNPIVRSDQIGAWEEYVQTDANSWMSEGMYIQQEKGLNGFVHPSIAKRSWLTNATVDPLHTFDDEGNPMISKSKGPFLPRWQTSPVLPMSLVNENLFEKQFVSHLMRDSIRSKAAIVGGFHSAPAGAIHHPDPTTTFFAALLSIWKEHEVEYPGDPISHIAIPIFDSLNGTDRNVVGIIKSTIYWNWFLRNILPTHHKGVCVVIENACDGSFTYLVEGPEVIPIGFGNRHDPRFSAYRVDGILNKNRIDDGTVHGVEFDKKSCPYTFHIYPAQGDYDMYVTNEPVVISLSVASVFLFTIGMFLVYDRLVERRQRLILAKATQSTAIVSSLFPKQVRDRLLAIETQKNEKRKGEALVPATHKLKTFLNGNDLAMQNNDQPIADFFPDCTVFFADIAGFTAWSSTREPAQVFMLLQTVYQNFDLLAKRHKVFKVETIGDSYVAVTGLPEPQPKHATIMVRFAWECLVRIGEITKELEVTLGPDTNDLSMRFGLHSGSVTAGVLKGDRARFQLFGDTVNTASRMESTGMKGRIQVSEATAEILRQAGKGSWLTKRTDQVNAKGKGIINTYWIALKNSGPSTGTGSSGDDVHGHGARETFSKKNPKRMDAKYIKRESRLVDWMTELLTEQIATIVIVRDKCAVKRDSSESDLIFEAPHDTICLDEVKDAISMPKFNADVAEAALDSKSVKIPSDIASQLRQYVTLIARSYRRNPFHNFEHACHVTMSVSKLLKRVIAPNAVTSAKEEVASKKERQEIAAEIHNFTHGITSDPMASFAIIFSAMIHDVDHQGVSNAQLIKEEPALGVMYRNKSVAEQNSLDVAWDLLMSEQFLELRRYIFACQGELLRFRQLIVNIVLATDIFDKDIGDRRKARWEQAFHGDGSLPEQTISNMRATIVMEHIIQASDVSHTMQHWHVYQKWNRMLFIEMYQAWKNGRMGADPREFWYKGELSFFDNYVIPLAKKLKECNVFGVSSDEYLGYALRNRAEWEERGQDILKGLIDEGDSVLCTVHESEGTGTDSTCSVMSDGSKGT